MINAIVRAAHAIRARLEVAHALAFEQIGCEHDAEHECQDCYLWRRAENW